MAMTKKNQDKQYKWTKRISKKGKSAYKSWYSEIIVLLGETTQ